VAKVKKNPPIKKRWSWKNLFGGFLGISILAHLLFISGATYLVVQRIQAKRKLTFQAGPPSPNPATQQVEHKVQMQKEQTMSAPQMAKRITTTGLGKVSLPEMPEMPTQTDDVKPMKMSQNLGMGTATMLGGNGGRGGFGNGITLPSIMADRCSPEGRAKSIADNGGNPKDDDAIIRALRWLKANQNPDGSWGKAFKGGMTGLALLSFLGHCERPNIGEFAPTVKNGIDCLVTVGTRDNGNLSNKGGGNAMVYEHAISTYAMGEAYIITKDERMPPILKQAIAMIVAGQRPDGGWMYNFAQPVPTVPDSDTSVSCWMIQGLKTAHYSGLNIDGVDACLDRAMKNLLRVQGGNGVFGYRVPGVGGNLTGAAVYCLLMWHHAKDKEVRDGLKVIKDGPLPARGKKGGSPPVYEYQDKTANLYAWYYDTQACFQAGGGAWAWWNHKFQRELLDNQSADGSWPPIGPPGYIPPGPAGKPAPPPPIFTYAGLGNSIDAQVYRTSMCVLMLEVYYRYLSNSKVENVSIDSGSE